MGERLAPALRPNVGGKPPFASGADSRFARCDDRGGPPFASRAASRLPVPMIAVDSLAYHKCQVKSVIRPALPKFLLQTRERLCPSGRPLATVKCQRRSALGGQMRAEGPLIGKGKHWQVSCVVARHRSGQPLCPYTGTENRCAQARDVRAHSAAKTSKSGRPLD